MTCQRCQHEYIGPTFQVKTDVMNILVCVICAAAATKLGLPVRQVSVEGGEIKYDA